jgi:hypothetical protein
MDKGNSKAHLSIATIDQVHEKQEKLCQLPKEIW